MKKWFIFLIGLLSVPIFNVKAEELNLAPSAKSAMLIEASTGEVIFSRNENEKLNPASMTKMMTMLLVMESIDSGVISMDDVITVSENASQMGGSQILLETGEKMTVSDLLKGVAVASGNDAAVALAEAVAGTQEAFVNMMNNRAKELGLINTNFKNCHGLDEANHYSSSYDMAMIAKELVKHEEILEFSSIYEDYLRKGTDKEFWLVNTNKLVRFYSGVDGLKTGYTKEAGYCLTATAKKNNMRIIAVVMGEEDSKVRNSEVSSMLDYAFAQYEIDTLLSKNSIVSIEKIEKASNKYVEIVPIEDINILNKKMGNKKTATYELKLDKLTAPIKKGDIVGTLVIKEDEKISRKVNVTVKEDVNKINLFQLYYRNLIEILTGDISFN